MSQLIDLQQAFQRFLLASPSPSLPDWISHNGRAAPEKQLSIYNNAYRARLKEVLAIDFPAVLDAMGEQLFNRLAENYIDTHPSRFYSLRDFGCDLPQFLQQAPACHDQPWLSELARFERMLGHAFDAADDTVFDEQDMARIPPEDWPPLRLVLHPSVQRLDCEWNAPGMWQSLTDQTPQEFTATREHPVPWLIWRQRLTTHYRSLGAEEQLALDAVLIGCTIDDVCAELSSMMAEDNVPLRFASLLRSWIAQGMISGVD